MAAKGFFYPWALSLTALIAVLFCSTVLNAETSPLQRPSDLGILTYRNTPQKNVVPGQKQILLSPPAAHDYYGAYIYRGTDKTWYFRVRNREPGSVRVVISAEGHIRVPNAEAVAPIVASTSSLDSRQQLFLDTSTPVISALIPIETTSAYLEFESITVEGQTNCPVYIGRDLVCPGSFPFRIEVEDMQSTETEGLKDTVCNYEYCLENIEGFTFRLVYLGPTHKLFPEVFVDVSRSGDSAIFDGRSIHLSLDQKNASSFLKVLENANVFLPVTNEEAFRVLVQCGGNQCMTYIDSATAIGIIHSVMELTADHTADEWLSDLLNRIELSEATVGDK